MQSLTYHLVFWDSLNKLMTAAEKYKGVVVSIIHRRYTDESANSEHTSNIFTHTKQHFCFVSVDKRCDTRMYDYILCLLEKQNMFQTLSKAEM